ncbi:hypothetical protein FOWG_12024 [Fusarium oxysporum f. sp. lycopersici MN25]|nr:hypothetical protein FOWG_12024 [Fusarium oxysporum f. sp. lycopersici MN25]
MQLSDCHMVPNVFSKLWVQPQPCRARPAEYPDTKFRRIVNGAARHNSNISDKMHRI